ncbi:MAG: DNA repair protein RecN [Christensenella sp.]|nr:DNA repair protein RecN [Christensenella sp.]
MIQSLSIKNIALIDQLNIEFEDGLNVLSGETGAGKSIIVDSMNLVLGERADKELIRHGQERARVEAVFFINPDALKDFFDLNGIECDRELIIARDISANGKNICRINGAAVTLSVLKDLMDKIVDLHGQHQHQSLLNAKTHLDFIDNYGKKEILPLKRQVQVSFEQMHALQKELRAIGGDARERAQQIDLLNFQIKELEDAQLRAGELNDLKEEREKMIHAQAIATALRGGYEALYTGDEMGRSILGGVQEVFAHINEIRNFDGQYEELAGRLQESMFSLEECAHEMRSLAENAVFDEQRQEEVEQRINLIHSLERKYGNSEEEMLQYLEDARQRCFQLENAEQTAAVLIEKIKTAQSKLYADSKALSAQRRKISLAFSKRLLSECSDLGMPETKFEAEFCDLPEQDTASYTANGLDEMEFYITTNPGEPLKPLSKTASGGEVSRIMLAFKNLSAGIDNISTMIFDEIDTGISGKMALVVAEKMASISKARQVICVSHLPQIAAMADANFLIRKESKEEHTHTYVQPLGEQAKIEEIERLSGGVKTENSQKYAQDLICNANKYKEMLRQH